MKSWTIKKRIIVGFATILTLVAAMAAASYLVLRRVIAEARIMDEDTVPNLSATSEIKGLVGEIEICLLRDLVAKTPEERKSIEGQIAELRAGILKRSDDYKKNLSRAEDLDTFHQMEQARDAYVAVRNKLFEMTRADKMDEALAYAALDVRPAYTAYQNVVDKMLKADIQDADASSTRSLDAARRADSIVVGFSIAVLGLGSLFAAVIVIGLNRVLTRLASSLNGGANHVAAAAGQVSGASQSLAEGSTEQAASLEETSSSLEEMSGMTSRNSDNATKANDLTRQAC